MSADADLPEPLASFAVLLGVRDDPGVQAVGQRMALYLAKGATVRLDKVLGLSTHGGTSPAQKLAQTDRNRSLRFLYRSRPEWRDLTPGKAAKAMVAAFRKYETDRWPYERDQTSAPVA